MQINPDRETSPVLGVRIIALIVNLFYRQGAKTLSFEETSGCFLATLRLRGYGCAVFLTPIYIVYQLLFNRVSIIYDP